MVFYGLNGSSVAFNGSVVRARSFDVYKVNVSVIDNTSYTSYSAYPYSMMYTTAYDSAKNVLYTGKVEAAVTNSYRVTHGYISLKQLNTGNTCHKVIIKTMSFSNKFSNWNLGNSFSIFEWVYSYVCWP